MFLTKKAQKITFWPKNLSFSGIKYKNFQKWEEKKSEKTFPRYMYLDGFGKFLAIFVPK